MEFKSLDALALYLTARARLVDTALPVELEQVAQLLERSVTEALPDSAKSLRIDHEVNGLVAVVGSPDAAAVALELGVPGQPPQPVFMPALQHCEPEIERALGAAVLAGIVGK